MPAISPTIRGRPLRCERLLADYFELPVRVRQFHGQWLYLSEESQSSLPCPRWPEGLNAQLGRSVDRRPAGVGRGGEVSACGWGRWVTPASAA